MNKIFSIFFALILLNACKTPLIMQGEHHDRTVLILTRDTPDIINQVLQVSPAFEFWRTEKVDVHITGGYDHFYWVPEAFRNEPYPLLMLHLKLEISDKTEELRIINTIYSFPGVRKVTIL